VLSFCTPSGLTAEWLDAPVSRLGAVAADVVANTPFAVWSGGRIAEGGQVDAVIAGARHAITVSQGVRALTAPIEVAEVQGYEVVRLGNYPALNVLVKSLPGGAQDMDEIPLHMLIGGVTIGDPDTAIRDGRFRLNHIVGANLDNRSITLSRPLNQGERLFWAMRDALASERDMHEAADRAQEKLGGPPDFAIMFPCVGRGPSFYGNRDRDVELIKSRYPGLPFIGCYPSGEIGPLDGENALHQYSTILGLFNAR
jgi:small ligand-binding sensory domain FIST